MVAATEPKSIQKAVQISDALTDEAVRNGSIKKLEKKENVGEPSKDKNGRDDNKRTRTRNVFDTTINPVGRENMGVWPNVDQKVKYTAGSFVGKALTWWISQIRTLSREVAISMSWDNFKFMIIEEFCPSHEMQKFETELWNHAMVRAGHAA
uniref:Reverse transcriptase domain-containing protein n=1 Tax=Tanacetum cinerariifolium TaxID=118510 RepID=A0A699RZH4_TANCI|nr:reverse transcriptase domain-containing protein [Tanacetum cinerariifolium]